MAAATDAAPDDDAKPAKGGKKGLIFGLLAGLVMGGAGFFLVWSGMVDPTGGGHEGEAETAAAEAPVFAFVPMEPIMISLPPGASARHLRFVGQLEVDPAHQAEVAGLMPRILDTLNTYLRAVDVKDLENPASIQMIRAQMLRRVQVVTGEGRIRDLLITEFILN
jgi:flagellar FliL protein